MDVIRLQGKLEQLRGIYYEVDLSRPPIGVGGTGRVYEGVCINEYSHDSKRVAVKFLFDDLSNEVIERARREASIHLTNDNLIEMLGFVETYENTPAGPIMHYHVISELLHGVSLSDALKGVNTDFEGNKVEYVLRCQEQYAHDKESFAKDIIRSVLTGLTALHEAGYIHRDIDPSNIMLTSDGFVKLIDFGIAKDIDSISYTYDSSGFTQTGSFVGKPKYAAPETCLGDIIHQDRTTDIYAVGIMLFQLLTGHLPFDGPANDIVQMQQKKRVPVEEINNRALRKVVKRATEKKQSKRYQSASDFLTALDNVNAHMEWSTIIIPVLVLVGLLIGIALALIF